MAELILTTMWGNTQEINFSIEKYASNGNLAIQIWSRDEYGDLEPWSMLTVNLTKKCKPNCAFIDTNNNGEHIVEWLEKNNLGMPTGNFEVSGFCIYPEFEFNMREIKKHVLFMEDK